MNRIERAIIIIIGIIISVIVSIGVLMILPFPYGLAVGISFPIILMYVIIKKSKIDSQSQNDDVQKLKEKGIHDILDSKKDKKIKDLEERLDKLETVEERLGKLETKEKKDTEESWNL